MSASKNQRLNLFESEAPKMSSLDSTNTQSAKPSSKPIIIQSKPLQVGNPPLKFSSLKSEADENDVKVTTHPILVLFFNQVFNENRVIVMLKSAAAGGRAVVRQHLMFTL